MSTHDPDDGDAISNSVDELTHAIRDQRLALAVELFCRTVDKGLVLGDDNHERRAATLRTMAARALEAAEIFLDVEDEEDEEDEEDSDVVIEEEG
jgi:hypothetical protein